MVKLLPNQFKSLRQVHKGLVRKYEGPFPILERVGKAAYRVQLPARLKIHDVFHVSMLKPFHQDMEDPNRAISNRAPMGVTTEYDKNVETILAQRRVSSKGVPSHFEYLVKWTGLPDSEASWEKEGHLWQFADKVSNYWQEVRDEGVASISGGGCHGKNLPHKFRDTAVPIPLA